MNRKNNIGLYPQKLTHDEHEEGVR